MAEFKHNFYTGQDYGFPSQVESSIGQYAGQIPASNIGTAVNAQTANQLKAVSDALNTGQKNVEVQLTFPNIEKEIPKDHLKEIANLKKLTGASFTMHGPMVEPTGVDIQNGTWSEQDRERAEQRMWSAIERSRDIENKENMVITFHASTGLPEMETKIKTKDGKEITTHLGAVNIEDGRTGMIPLDSRKDYLSKKDPATSMFTDMNEQSWSTELSSLNIEMSRTNELFREAFKVGEQGGKSKEEILKEVSDFKKYPLEKKRAAENVLGGDSLAQKEELLDRSSIYLRDASNKFKQLYNKAYKYAELKNNSEDLKKLEKFGEKWRSMVDSVKSPSGTIEDYSKLNNVSEVIDEGIDMLSNTSAPAFVEPIKDFALDKASETFSNLAFNSFSKYGSTAPIISLENHPVGQTSGFNRAEDIKLLVENIREKFVEKAKKKGMSEKEAELQAKKMIGVTWDVGHINNLRRLGYDDKDLEKQTEKIAPYIKHIHLADNFGLEDAELPIGMGNVPMELHEKALRKAGVDPKKVKRIVEAATYIQQFGGASPLPTVLENYGSSIYTPEVQGPYWNQQMGYGGAGYNSGYGQMLPNTHFSMYGASFSALPADLGGQVQGGSSRFSGTPME